MQPAHLPARGRRRFVAALAAATVLLASGPALAFAEWPAEGQTERFPSTAATASRAMAVEGAAIQPFAAGDTPFDAAGRRGLAMDALTFFVRQQGLFPGRGVYQLPAAPWFGSGGAPEPNQTWDVSIPASVPIYLLADADPAGQLDPSRTSITVNGRPLTDLAAYVHAGVPALSDGRMHDFAVLDLVFPPPPPGRYRVEVQTRRSPDTAGCVPAQATDTLPDLPDFAAPVALVAPWCSEAWDGTRGAMVPDAGADGAPQWDGADGMTTTLVYDLTVRQPDALGPLLLRDGAGNVFAMVGHERRRLPDADTIQLLGYSMQDVVAAAPGILDALSEGEAIPALRDGMLLRTASHPAVFRLQDGQRVWIRDVGRLGSADVRSVDAPLLQTIPPLLQDGLLLKGAAADVYHVDRGSLRKIPDWTWVTDHGLRPEETLYVPDRLIAALPQNSPHWVLPGGTRQDRAFSSAILGRSMPYRIYLPPSYEAGEQTGRRYPVLYLLHGMGGRYDEWSGYGAEEVANQLLADGQFAEVILVLPQGGLGYWMNQAGGTPWADYVARDLVAHVDATYRTLPQREARAVGGLSMGAHGALQLAFNYPAVFGVAGAHSPSLRSQATAPAYFGGDAGFASRDPLSLVQEAQLTTPPLIWIDAGDRDPWLLAADALREALVERGWAHEWRIYQGEHDGWYWGDHLWDYLPFYAGAFAQGGVSLADSR